MSHHLDTPLARQNGQLYIDDLYVFTGNDSTVFVMDVNSDITGVYAEPGFHPEARYEFKVHFDGADFEALTYRVSFGEPDSDGRQALRLHALAGGQAREDAAAGELVLEGRTSETASAGGVRVWAGRTADSFYLQREQRGRFGGKPGQRGVERIPQLTAPAAEAEQIKGPHGVYECRVTGVIAVGSPFDGTDQQLMGGIDTPVAVEYHERGR